MSKKEGQILKKAIKEHDYTVEKFAQTIGYTHRTAISYYFDKDRLPYELKEKAANAFKSTVEEIFDQYEQNFSSDREKELLTDLADTQKKLIEDREKASVDANKLLINKALSNEAWAQVIVRRLADLIHLYTEGKTDKKTVEDQSRREAKAIFEGLVKELSSVG